MANNDLTTIKRTLNCIKRCIYTVVFRCFYEYLILLIYLYTICSLLIKGADFDATSHVL